MKYFAYILRSLKSNIHYYGSTSNLDGRLSVHNSGKVTFTKPHKPWTIIYFEEFETRSEAMKRERFLIHHFAKNIFSAIKNRDTANIF